MIATAACGVYAADGMTKTMPMVVRAGRNSSSSQSSCYNPRSKPGGGPLPSVLFCGPQVDRKRFHALRSPGNQTYSFVEDHHRSRLVRSERLYAGRDVRERR